MSRESGAYVFLAWPDSTPAFEIDAADLIFRVPLAYAFSYMTEVSGLPECASFAGRSFDEALQHGPWVATLLTLGRAGRHAAAALWPKGEGVPWYQKGA